MPSVNKVTSLSIMLFATIVTTALIFSSFRPLWAATIIVNSTEDLANPDTGVCTLRAAVRAANTNTAIGGCVAGTPGVDTVTLPAGVYTLTAVGAFEGDSLTGDLNILESAIIKGASRDTTIIDGNATDRIFSIPSSSFLVIENLTLRNGRTQSGLFGMEEGGAIISGGVLTITNSIIRNSTASVGGGIYSNLGTIFIFDSQLVENSAESGGAIETHLADLSIVNSTLARNRPLKPIDFTSNSTGGAISTNGVLTITGSIIEENSAYRCGGVNVSAQALISDTKFISNRGHVGGGLCSLQLLLKSSTFSNNVATKEGAGLLIFSTSNLAIVDIDDSHFYSNAVVMENNISPSGGGAISIESALVTITRSSFVSNSAEIGGGGIYLKDSFYDTQTIIRDSVFSGNTASLGGAIHLFPRHATVIISNTSIVANFASRGGGIFNSVDNLTIYGSAIISNYIVADATDSFQQGSGVLNAGFITVSNSTISHNKTKNNDGAAINNIIDYGMGDLVVVNSTLASNQSPAFIRALGRSAIFSNTIIAYNGPSTNCGSEITQGTNNLQFPGTSCGASILSQDPLLGPLAENGSSTLTHALLPNSPAIDQGNNTVCASLLVNNLDQRGVTRPIGINCDIGAVEASLIQATPTPTLTSIPTVVVSTPTTTPTATPVPNKSVYLPVVNR